MDRCETAEAEETANVHPQNSALARADRGHETKRASQPARVLVLGSHLVHLVLFRFALCCSDVVAEC